MRQQGEFQGKLLIDLTSPAPKALIEAKRTSGLSYNPFPLSVFIKETRLQ